MTKPKKEKKCAECEKNLAGWKRALADYENLKKQIDQEKDAFVKFANLNLVMGLIPVYNNLKLSFDHLPKDMQDNSWVKGMEQVQKQFQEVLKYNHVEEIIPKKGDKFDPQLHEAIKSDGKKDEIQEMVSCGYKLNGKVFIPAKVIIK